MLVFQFKIILIRFFCLEHQHGRHGFCWVGPWGMNANALYEFAEYETAEHDFAEYETAEYDFDETAE